MTTIQWSPKTGEKIIFAARALIHDTDTYEYSIPVEVGVELYRQCLLQVADEIHWKSDERKSFVFGAGEHEKTFFPVNPDELTIINLAQATFGIAGFLHRRPPEEIRAHYDADLAGGGSIQLGLPRMWGLERTIAESKVLLYPGTNEGGTVYIYANQLAFAVNDPAEVCPFDWGGTKVLELCIAAQMAARLSEDQLMKLKLSPNAANVIQSTYVSAVSRERVRAGMNRRMSRVVIRGA